MKMKLVSLLLSASALVSYPSARPTQTPAADPPPPVMLELRTENRAFYVHDQPNYSLLASSPNTVFPAGAGKTFTEVTGIGDIKAMNGRPAKGTFIAWFTVLHLTPQPAPGQAIADVTRFGVIHYFLDVMDADGKSLGAITVEGLGDGPLPPNSPSRLETGSFVITGGTGIFLGARGQAGEKVSDSVFGRPASTNEDPSQRRIHGGGSASLVFAFIRNSCPYAKIAEN